MRGALDHNSQKDTTVILQSSILLIQYTIENVHAAISVMRKVEQKLQQRQ